MNLKEFREQAHKTVDRIADYFDGIREYNVKSQVLPGDIFNQIPDTVPEDGEVFEDLMEDFENIILPGITHWQHPKFHAYFPANNSYPSVLGEMLTAALGAQCMMWETSPAATELEEKMMIWLRYMIGLPKEFHGVIQDTASTAVNAGFFYSGGIANLGLHLSSGFFPIICSCFSLYWCCRSLCRVESCYSV